MNVERSASAADADGPWPGLAPFTEAQSAQFFGRDAEIKTLSRRVQGDPLTVLFGQSGLGKSSLLQAGVFPRLRSADFCPIYLRLDHAPGAPALSEQVKQTVCAETARAGSWTKGDFAKPGESLWEFFHHRDNRLVSPGGIALSPVLVFDQFEELFTLGGAAHSAGSTGSPQAGSGSQGNGETARQRAVAFMTELAELVENRPPEALVARVEQSPAELDALDFGATDYRVVITLREDYLPHLESLKTIMPALMDNRMRLSRMNGVQALEAVVKPGAGLVTDEVARAIVEFVAGARGGSTERLAELDVEPPLLSIICRELNERRRAAGAAQITADLVTGNRREILTDFYERSVADLPEAMRTFVEDHLLTKSGFRDNLSLESALDFPGVTRPLIDTLVNRRLLRIEDRLGVERVELTHDVLAEVIRASRDTHHQKLEVAQARERERITRRRMWLARTIAAALLVGLTGVSWIAWRAVHAEREQTRLRADADVARARETKLRVEAEAQERAAQRIAYASDMNAVQSALAIDNLGRARDLLNRHRPAPGEVDLRGWEWRYLWQFCQSDATTILKPANDNSALSVAASADATWVAVGSRAGDVRIYNRQTKEEIRVPAGDRSVRVAFSPRAPLLAIATGDRSVRRTAVVAGDALPTNRVLFWDANTRQVIRELEIPGVANGLLFSDDGQTLVISSGRSTNNISRDVTEVSVWRVLDGSKVAAWTAGLTSVQVAYSWFAATRDASAAAVVTALNTVAVIDLKTGRERWNTVATDDTLLCMAFSPDGRILATGAGYVDSTIRLWDAATGKPLGRLEGQRGFTTSIAFLADGKRLVSGSGDQTLRLWDLGSRTPIRTFRGHKTEVHALALAPDQRTLVSGCKDGSAMVWDLEAERGASSSGSLAKGRVAWEFADAGASLITLGADGRVARWRGRTFQEESKLLEIGAVQIGSVLAARSGLRAVMDAKRPLLAAVTEAGKLQVWDWERRALVSEWNENIEERIPIPRRFSNDGTKLFVSVVRGNDLLLEEWDILIGRQTRSFNLGALMQARTSWITSADGMQQVIVASGDLDSVRVDLAPGRVTPFKLNTPQVAQSALSPDARLLAVPSDVGFVRVFETANYREIAKLTGFMFGAHASDFSPDQQRLAIGSTALETVTLWDANNYERLVSLASRGQASLLRFSPDGNVIAGQTVTGTNAGTLHFWRAPSWAEIEQAEAPEAAKAAERAATAGTPRN